MTIETPKGRALARHGDLDVLVHDEHSTIALWRTSVLIQRRSKQLTVAALARMQELLRSYLTSERPLGTLFISEVTAQLPKGEARVAQIKLLEQVGARENIRMAAVILGEDLNATLNRSASRMIQTGNPRVRRFSDLLAAADWLAEELAGMGVTVGAQTIVAQAIEVQRIAAEKP